MGLHCCWPGILLAVHRFKSPAKGIQLTSVCAHLLYIALIQETLMPVLDQAAKWATNRLPKVINPTAHAIIDYGMAASFFGMAAFFWNRNKRAAISCLVCG